MEHIYFRRHSGGVYRGPFISGAILGRTLHDLDCLYNRPLDTLLAYLGVCGLIIAQGVSLRLRAA